VKPELARVEKLYHSALAVEPSQRAVFLTKECGDDGELRREIESLLAHAEEEDGFLEAPAIQLAAMAMAAGSVRTSSVPAIPAKIGHYRVLRLLGEGGMGAVYEAEQEQPRRMVALKVIKPGFATSENLRRFQHESQALGRLQHPGIAQIYEANTADAGLGPQPYFAMELIRGHALCEYAVEQNLDARGRLELMGKVCDAVAHAHQRGVIHRDLKPSNILVDETGQPKILDFGVARVTESDVQHTRQTDVGEIVGTLAYMSPEQVVGDPQALDIRSDVYALGVILYELLVGKLPYNIHRRPLHEALEVIREEEPVPVSSIQPSYRGDINTIVAKALEKDKSRRYASAADLAGDIRCYLGDEPITARPASTSYRLQKFAQRHKALVAGTAAVFLVLAAGVVASTWQAMRARTAEQAAASEAAAARAINDFLRNDLLAQASAATQSGPQSTPDPDLKVRTALDRAAAHLTGKFDRQPEVEAAVRETIGQTYLGLGLYPQARSQLERALEVGRRLLGVETPKTLKIVSALGRTAYLQGRYPDAETLYGQAVASQQRVLGLTNADTLSSMSGLATAYTAEGKYAQGEALYRKTLEIQRRVLGPEHPDTLSSMSGLAIAYGDEGKYAQETELDRQTFETRRRVLGPEHPDTLMSMNNLAGDYVSQGDYAQATALFNQAIPIQRRVLGPEHHDTLMSIFNLATAYADEGEYAQAETLYRENLDIKRRVLGPEHSETLLCMGNLAACYIAHGKYAEGAELSRQTLQIQRRVLGPEHRDALLSMETLAVAYGGQGKYMQAEELFSRTVDVSRRVLGPDDAYTLSFLADFAFMYQREEKYGLAETYARQALAGRRRALGSGHPDTIAASADLALAYLSQGRFKECESLAREALDFDRRVQPDNWQRFRAESLLGASLAGEKKYAEAEPALMEGYQGLIARKARMAVSDQYHVNLAHRWLLTLYRAWGKPRRLR
jgi:eukaryotic-like serine/threonine-protein kinase